jgi:hypothetical protein
LRNHLAGEDLVEACGEITVDLHAIPAELLGPVERLVGALERLGESVASCGDTDACGAELETAGVRGGFQCGSDPFGHRHTRSAILSDVVVAGHRKDDHELFTAVAGEDVRCFGSECGVR